MTSVQRLRLRPEVYLATRPGGEFALLHGGTRGERIGSLTEGELAALRQLGSGWFTEGELRATIERHDGRSSKALLRRLVAGGWISVRVELPGRPLITVRPLGPNTDPPVRPVAPRLSRFAVLRREAGTLVLESPLARAAVTVHDHEVLTVLMQLAGSGPATEGLTLPGPVVTELIALLAWYRFVHEAEEDTRPDLAHEQWTPHELLFHSRSRTGYHDEPFGATMWSAGRFDPLPGRRDPFAGTAVALRRPQPGDAADPPLTDVLESRRSIREHDDARPITVEQLGEFLYRTARVLRVDADGRHEVSMRPSPSGGAIHGLEVYPVVRHAAGLGAGIYHYDPFEHLLEPLPPREFPAGQLLARAAAAAGRSAPPQVLLVLACRFGRVMWKYRSMSYALVLKEVGALFQTFYLVATAMGLAPCALGSGDVELFARATDLDPLIEGSVGEFMLGSRTSSTR